MGAASHAAFVWSAYGLAGATVLGLVVRSVVDYRAQTRALARLAARDPAESDR